MIARAAFLQAQSACAFAEMLRVADRYNIELDHVDLRRAIAPSPYDSWPITQPT